MQACRWDRMSSQTCFASFSPSQLSSSTSFHLHILCCVPPFVCSRLCTLLAEKRGISSVLWRPLVQMNPGLTPSCTAVSALSACARWIKQILVQEGKSMKVRRMTNLSGRIEGNKNNIYVLSDHLCIHAKMISGSERKRRKNKQRNTTLLTSLTSGIP